LNRDDNSPMAHPTITIHADQGDHPGSCSACVHGRAQTVCRAVLGQDCIAPELSGPRDEIDRLMNALAGALGFRLDAEEAIPVAALHVEPGEVALTLAAAPRCGDAGLAAQAFDTLRALLPDTDIYVRHAAG
jgi:hypothetical protein